MNRELLPREKYREEMIKRGEAPFTLESDIRDAHITSEIERYWKQGKSILIVFGAGHLVIQEPAL